MGAFSLAGSVAVCACGSGSVSVSCSVCADIVADGSNAGETVLLLVWTEGEFEFASDGSSWPRPCPRGSVVAVIVTIVTSC